MDTHRTLPRPTTPDPVQVERFAREGYLVLKGFVPNVAEFNDTIEAIVREHADKPVFMRFEKPLSLSDIGYTYETFATTSSSLRIPEIHALSARLRELVDAFAFEDYLAGFFGRRVDLLQSLYFPFSSNQASHSDKFLVSPPGRPYARETLTGVWLALDGTGPENGALFGWTGSQKVTPKPYFGDYAQYGDYARDLALAMVNSGLRPHFIFVEPGDVVLWGSDFVHGGARPLSQSARRRALVLHYGALDAAAAA